MVLALLESIYTSPSFLWPRTHLPHILLTLLLLYTLRLLSQGRRTTRDRDLHARTVILTGAFESALGVTLLVELARRGCGVVCLTGRDVGSVSAGASAPSASGSTRGGKGSKEEEEKHPYADPSSDLEDDDTQYPLPEAEDEEEEEEEEGDPSAYGDPHIHTLVTLVRATTKNPNIWAETCDIEDADSVKRFCMRWLTGGQGNASLTSGASSKETGGRSTKDEPSMPGLGPDTAKGGGGGGGSAPADQRLDAIIFTHEYPSLGSLLPKPSWFPALRRRSTLNSLEDEKRRERRSLGSFLMTTLLLPSLLVAPTERDIRIVNVVNPFYAAAVKSVEEVAGGSGFSVARGTSGDAKGSKEKKMIEKGSVFLKEGIRSLRTVVLTRHLQRILDALPAPQAPITSTTSTTPTPIPSRKMQKSNIVAVSVSPGVSRVDTVAPLLEADWDVVGGRGWSGLGVGIYILLQPLLRIFTKSPTSAVQSVLHALFLPTPFKSLASRVDGEYSGGADGLGSTKGDVKGSGSKGEKNGEEKEGGGEKKEGKEGGGGRLGGETGPVFREVLKPGGLYNECAVVTLDALRPLSPSPSPSTSTSSASSSAPSTAKGSASNSQSPKGGNTGKPGSAQRNGKPSGKPEDLDLTIEDDGEYGGEEVGRRVWEAYEAGLKVWESAGKASR